MIIDPTSWPFGKSHTLRLVSPWYRLGFSLTLDWTSPIFGSDTKSFGTNYPAAYHQNPKHEEESSSLNPSTSIDWVASSENIWSSIQILVARCRILALMGRLCRQSPSRYMLRILSPSSIGRTGWLATISSLTTPMIESTRWLRALFQEETLMTWKATPQFLPQMKNLNGKTCLTTYALLIFAKS